MQPPFAFQSLGPHRGPVATPAATLDPSPRERWQAWLLALLCAVLFLREGLLPTRALLPYPNTQMAVPRAEALAAGTFDPAAARRGLAAGGDKYLQSLCWDAVLQRRLSAGELPRWTRDIASGVPFVPQMAQVYEPVNLLLLLLPAAGWYGLWYLLHLCLFGGLAYGCLRRFGIGHAAGLLGVVAAVLGQWTQCKIHHNVILTAALPLWPMLSAVLTMTSAAADAKPRRRAAAAMGLWSGVSWLSGFAVVSLQVTYLVLAVAALRLATAERSVRRPALGWLTLGLGLGALLSCAQMVPVLQAASRSARDAGWNPAFLAAHGLEWDHALAALWPDLLAWSSDSFYAQAEAPLADATRMPWSQLVLLGAPNSPATGAPFQSWVETSFAVGTAPLACAALAWRMPGRRALATLFGGLGLLAFALATADPPLLHLARYLPGLASADLRRLLFTVAMALVVLAALGADALLQGARRWPMALVLGAAALGSTALYYASTGDLVARTAALLALDRDHAFVQQCRGEADVIATAIRGAMAQGELAANQDHLATTALRSLLAVGLAALALCWQRGRVGLLLAGTIGELLWAGLGCFVAEPLASATTPPRVVDPVVTATARAEQSDGVRPRLCRLAGADARLSAYYPSNLPGAHGLEDATGYNPLPARRFEEFFAAIEPPAPDRPDVRFGGGGSGVGPFHDPRSLQHPLCDLFGIRYVLAQRELPTSAALVERTPAGSGGYRLYERTTTLPRATFVRSIERILDPEARRQRLADPSREVLGTTLLEVPHAVQPRPRPCPPAVVTITSHRDERVVVRVQTEGDGYLRLADPFDPGWRATVDGVQTEVFAADHYLRAVYLKGRPEPQEVVFTYDAASVVWPGHVSLLALLTLLWLLRRQRRAP